MLYQNEWLAASTPYRRTYFPETWSWDGLTTEYTSCLFAPQNDIVPVHTIIFDYIFHASNFVFSVVLSVSNLDKKLNHEVSFNNLEMNGA